MHTPTPEQFQTVIDTLKSVLPMAQHKNHFKMTEPCVQSSTHACGTTHCVAGWYLIGTGEVKESWYFGYLDGADRMAQTLGFTDAEALKIWADDNPHIWGNEYGLAMFCMPIAWNGAKTLADCVVHLEGVRDRLKANEAADTETVKRWLKDASRIDLGQIAADKMCGMYPSKREDT